MSTHKKQPRELKVAPAESKDSHFVYVDEGDSPHESPASPPPTSVGPAGETSFSKMVLFKSLSNKNIKRGRSSGKGWNDYVVRLNIAGSISTSAAGIVANTYAADPSAIPFSEWATYKLVFDEVKLVAFELKITPYGNAATQMITSIATGAFINKGAVPASILDALNADNGTLVSPLMVRPHRCSLKVPPLQFAPTTTPAGTTAYGCPGYINLYATAGLVSSAIMTYQLTGHYHLRGRM